VLWTKLLANACINPLTAILRVKNGFLLHDPDCQRIIAATALEVQAVANARALEAQLPSSVSLLPDDPTQYAMEVVRTTAANTSSMLSDILRLEAQQRPPSDATAQPHHPPHPPHQHQQPSRPATEIEVITGSVVKEGLRLGVPTPVNAMLMSMVLASERAIKNGAQL
jgi:2-dehydropantoate 2-reductase